MAPLVEMLETMLPDAVSVGGPLPDGETAPGVGWVRVLHARVPALDVLEPGDLVIVPAASLAVVAPGSAEVRELVGTLARSGAAGLLLVPPGTATAGLDADAPSGDGLDTIAAAAADEGLPALRVPGIDPGALERRVIGYLVDRRGELERQAAALEGDLARLAMAGSGLETLVAAIGRFLRRAVALEGRRSDAIAVHAPSEVPGAAAAVAGYLSRPLSSGRRVALPGAPGETTPAGWLVLLGDAPPGDLEQIAAERIAPILALELMVESEVRRARDEQGRGDAMPSDGPPWVVLVARQGDPPEGGPSREEVRQELRFRFAARRLSLRGTSESLELRAIAALEPGDATGARIGVARRGVPRPDRGGVAPVRRPGRASRRGGGGSRDARRRGTAARAAAGGPGGPPARVPAAGGIGQPARRPDPGERVAGTAARRAPRERARAGSNPPRGPRPRCRR